MNILKGPEFQATLDKISLGEFFFSYAEKHGDKICQIDAEEYKSETYSSVKKRSVRLAINLRKKGINSKDVICFCCQNSLDSSIPVISSLYLGAKIASLDPSLSLRNTKHLLSLVEPTIIFVDEESLELIEKSLNENHFKCEIIIFGKSLKYQCFDDLVGCINENEFRPEKVNIHDIAIMFFSSGSTGLPKAICHSHYSFLQLTEAASFCAFYSQRILHFTTFYWVSGLMMLTCTFLDGTTRVFGRTMEGERTFQMIEKYKLTALLIAPIYTYLLTNVSNPQKYDVSSLRCLLTGGTSMSADQYKKLSHLFPKIQILFGYGMTETGILALFHPINDIFFINTKIGAVGKAAPGTCLKVVNPDTEKILGPNQKGEIRAKSNALMKGYYGTDSSQNFDSDGFLKTGDIGYYDEDNCFYIIARIKEMFKYKSWHIVPSSIEAVLLEHPSVEEAVVFGIPKAEEGEIPAACVVLKQNFDADKEEIEKFVEERVADRERLRGGVIFVKDLPRTPTGKLIRNEARNMIIKPM